MPRTLYTNFLPSADSTWSLGSTDLRWLKLWADDITMGGTLDVETLLTPYAQVVTVATSGADFNSIQDAIDSILDATTTKRYCIKVQSGVYTEAITMKDYVDIQGAGRTNTIIAGTTGTVLTFSATHCTVMDIGVNVNYGTLGAASQAIVSSGADSAFLRCDITVTKSAGDKLMTALAVSGGSFRMMECYFAYSITGATTGSALVQCAISHTGASTIFLLHSNEIVMTCDDTNDELVGFETVAGSTGSWLLENNIIFITGTLTATGIWIYGTATGATIGRNRITVDAAVAYGIYSESSAGTAVVDTRHNSFIISGAFNRSAYIGTGDTWNSTFDKITTTGGYTDSLGTINFVSSPLNGALSLTNLLTCGAGIIYKRTASAAGTYAVLSTDYIIAKTGITAGGDTITLDDDLTDAGRAFIIKDESGTAGTNNITIDPEGSTLIDGALTYVMNANYESKTVYSDGTNWFII